MDTEFKLKLIKIKYGGESVGDHIRVEIKKDLIFNDVGSTDVNITINPKVIKSQRESYDVKVSESRGLIPGKKTALFTITLEISPAYLYIPLTADGWIRTNQKGMSGEVPLSSFIEVKLNSLDSKREYITPQEGPFKDRHLWITRAYDPELLTSTRDERTGPVSLTYSISQKVLSLGVKKFQIVDYPADSWKKGTYDIELPDNPHFGGHLYPASKYAVTWFRVGHSDSRYIHTGQRSVGCMTMKETKKWDELCLILLKARKGDGINIGTLTVIE